MCNNTNKYTALHGVDDGYSWHDVTLHITGDRAMCDSVMSVTFVKPLTTQGGS